MELCYNEKARPATVGAPLAQEKRTGNKFQSFLRGIKNEHVFVKGEGRLRTRPMSTRGKTEG